MASVVLVLQAICVKLSSMISGRFALFTRNHEQTDKEEKKGLEIDFILFSSLTSKHSVSLDMPMFL